MGLGFVYRRPDNADSEVAFCTHHLSGEFCFEYKVKFLRPFNCYGAAGRPGVKADLLVLSRRWALPPRSLYYKDSANRPG